MPKAYVLLIDDEPGVRMVLSDMLQAFDIETAEASGGEQGIRMARERKPDLILLDVMMPVMDGFEVCRLIRNDPALAAVPVVMVTALTSLDHVEKAFAAGAKDYLMKPIQMKALQLKLGNALGIAL